MTEAGGRLFERSDLLCGLVVPDRIDSRISGGGYLPVEL